MRKGELREAVLAFLCERPEGEYSPTAIATALRRSPGAVANACERLTTGGVGGGVGDAVDTATGQVVRTSDRPKRYRFTGPHPTPAESGAGAGSVQQD